MRTVKKKKKILDVIYRKHILLQQQNIPQTFLRKFFFLLRRVFVDNHFAMNMYLFHDIWNEVVHFGHVSPIFVCGLFVNDVKTLIKNWLKKIKNFLVVEKGYI